MIRGKLLLPEMKVKFVDEEFNKRALEDFIRAFESIAEFACRLSNGKGKIAIDIIADALTSVFKLPMILPPVYTESKYAVTPFEYFFTYVIARHYKEFKLSSLKDFINDLDEERKNLSDLFRYISSLEKVYDALLNTPADTRPGFNFTSLASHLQMTSLLSWVLQSGSVDLNYLRIASLIHDIGKLNNPEHHVKEAKDIMEELYKGVEETCIREEFKRIRELVEGHHSDYFSIVENADRLSSSTDRLSKVVLDVLGDRLKDCYNKPAAEASECFKDKKQYEELSISLYKVILKSVNPKATYWDLKDVKSVSIADDVSEDEIRECMSNNSCDAWVLYIDFPGVQKFITDFPKLRDLSMASFLVDFLVSAYAIAYLDSINGKTKIPAEALLSAYGGHSYVIVRKDVKFPEMIPIKELDVKLVVKRAPLMVNGKVLNYRTVWYHMVSPERTAWEEKVYSYGLHKVCTSCGIRPASHKEGDEELCDRCYTVRMLSRNRSFSAKVSSAYRVDGKEIRPSELAKRFEMFSNEDKLLENAMEFIAGYEKEDDTKYVALLKADGNNGGEIFKSVATFSDFVDRSFKLDYGVKKAFRESVKELNDENLIARVLAGVMYLGGDDVFLILPSRIAVPFAVSLFSKAKEYTGFTFKVGVIAVKPTHPIQFAYQAANELMESSKIEGRPSPNSIAITVFSTTLATTGVVTRMINYWNKKRGFMVIKNDMEKVKDLLDMVGLNNYIVYKDDKEREKWEEKVREALRPLEDVVNYASDEENVYKVIAYMIRQRVRSEDGSVDSKIISKVIKDGVNSFIFPLLDYYFVLKSFRVGI